MNGGHLILNDTLLSGNTDSGNGGAIYNLFGIMNINDSTITSNRAYNNGGGIYRIWGGFRDVEQPGHAEYGGRSRYHG